MKNPPDQGSIETILYNKESPPDSVLKTGILIQTTYFIIYNIYVIYIYIYYIL